MSEDDDDPPDHTTTILKLTMEEAVDRLGTGRFQQLLMVAAGMCTASDAIEVLLLSFLAIVVQHEFGVSSHQSSWMTSIVFLGGLVGTLVLGPLGDSWGRKPAFLMAATIISLSGLLTALAPTYQVMLAFRFGVGVGLGGIVVAYDTVAEFLPNANRGTWLLYLGYFCKL